MSTIAPHQRNSPLFTEAPRPRYRRIVPRSVHIVRAWRRWRGRSRLLILSVEMPACTEPVTKPAHCPCFESRLSRPHMTSGLSRSLAGRVALTRNPCDAKDRWRRRSVAHDPHVDIGRAQGLRQGTGDGAPDAASTAEQFAPQRRQQTGLIQRESLLGMPLGLAGTTVGNRRNPC